VLVSGIALERLKRMDEFHKKFDGMADYRWLART